MSIPSTNHVPLSTPVSCFYDTVATPDSAGAVAPENQYFGEAFGRHNGDVSGELKYAATIRGSATLQIRNVANGSARVQGMYTLQK